VAKITFTNIGHTYDKNPDQSTWALKPISMVWESGRSYALVGPSGCGKTTILNIISGIVNPFQGQILFDDVDVTKVPTAKRNVALVFQFPTIYKSMTVKENLAFPLVCRGWKQEAIEARVGSVAEQIGISHKLDRSASKLGADEKQLISLGRGLVRDDVTALLMDEPLTVIDPQLKFELRKKIKQIIEGKDITVVYVTHDQYEAMTFADELLVMDLGQLVQRGTPEELFENPVSNYVGNFIGSPAMNFIKAEVSNGVAQIGQYKIAASTNLQGVANQQIHLGIRPEYVELYSGSGENVVSAELVGVDDLGSTRILNCRFEGQFIKAKIPRSVTPPALGTVGLRLPKAKVIGFKGGLQIR
jgi:glycerol transport system ATP-binding protein